MAAYFNLTLDTTAPAGVSISINAGAAYATSQTVTATIATTDSGGAPTGYQMIVYGDVDTSNDANVQATEGASTWITFATSKSVKLSSGDGSKTLRLKIRDDVNNASSEATDAITLDTTLPTVTITSAGGVADVSKISKQTGKRTATFTWQSDSQYDAYKVKVVPATGSIQSAGTQIPTTGGSTNMSGSTADQPAATNVTSAIDGADLETAGAEGVNIIKVFVQDDAGNWST